MTKTWTRAEGRAPARNQALLLLLARLAALLLALLLARRAGAGGLAPVDLGRWIPIGPGGGAVTALVFDPATAGAASCGDGGTPCRSPATAWAAAGTVYKSATPARPGSRSTPACRSACALASTAWPRTRPIPAGSMR
jgi:hypothetical protein